MSWIPVISTETFRWVPRELTLDTLEEVRGYGDHLKRSFDTIIKIEIIRSDEPANYCWDGKLMRRKPQ